LDRAVVCDSNAQIDLRHDGILTRPIDERVEQRSSDSHFPIRLIDGHPQFTDMLCARTISSDERKRADKLLLVLNKLVERGNTVMVIEHNLDVLKSVDHIIDVGPEGGAQGGTIVAAGTPEEVVKVKGSLTGKYLKKYL